MTAQLVFSPEAFRQFGVQRQRRSTRSAKLKPSSARYLEIIAGGVGRLRYDRVEFAGSVDEFAASFADDINSSFGAALHEDDGDIETNAKQFVDRLITTVWKRRPNSKPT